MDLLSVGEFARFAFEYLTARVWLLCSCNKPHRASLMDFRMWNDHIQLSYTWRIKKLIYHIDHKENDMMSNWEEFNFQTNHLYLSKFESNSPRLGRSLTIGSIGVSRGLKFISLASFKISNTYFFFGKLQFHCWIVLPQFPSI